MNSHFPCLLSIKRGQGHKAVAGFELHSLVMGSLVAFQQEEHMDKAEGILQGVRSQTLRLKSRREGLLQAICAWEGDGSLELLYTVYPDLARKTRGKVKVHLLLRAEGPTRAAARERAASRCLSLKALLRTYQPEAEFVLIADPEELKKVMNPFAVRQALSLIRRREEVALSVPFSHRTIGLEEGLGVARTEKFVLRHLCPWVPSHDDWAKFISMMMAQLDSVRVAVRVKPSELKADQRNNLESLIGQCEKFLSTGESMQLTLRMQAELIRNMVVRRLSELSHRAFDLAVTLSAPHPIDRALGYVLGEAITGTETQEREPMNLARGFSVVEADFQDGRRSQPFPDVEPFSLEEAACAFRLPSPPMQELAGLPLRHSRTALAMVPDSSASADGHTLELFLSEHHQDVVPISLSADDRMRHMFVLGQTGTGKSTFMEDMFLQDIEAGRGAALIDPHGDLVDSILGKIPRGRVEDVIVFDLLDRERPPGFNILQWETLEERDLIIDELYMTIDQIYDLKQMGGPIFESHFRGMLKLLMGDERKDDFSPTLLDFVNCYLSKDFRLWLLARTDEPTVVDFVQEVQKVSGDASLQNVSPYITSKIGRFVHDRQLSRIIGQDRSTFTPEVIMNEGKIFLVKLGKGRFGSVVSAILANQLVSRFKLAAMKRGNMAPAERKDFYLYVDECHTLPADNFTELLSEARKFRLGLTMATQYTAQIASALPGRGSLLSAILGNVGTIAIFRLGHEDAKHMAPTLYPNFGMLDIIGLPNWHGYARMQPGGNTVLPFSFRTRKNPIPFAEERADLVRNLSRQRYGTPAAEVDMQILRRRKIWTDPKYGD